MFEWLPLGVALLAASLAILRTRRTAKRLERLQESYWDLRYEIGQLQARLSRLEADTGAPVATASPPEARGAAFVPLSSLKR